MGRPLRVWYPGATYHVIVRGNRRQNIFRDNEDRLILLQKIGWVRSKYNFKLHSYVLMTNHYHFLIETGDINLADIMRDLNGFYTRTFNQKYDLSGHLFQGRYRAILVQQETYLMEVSRYIHLNPVRANIVKLPEDYKWSSFRGYLGHVDPVCYTEKILSMAGLDDRNRMYKDFVYDKLLDSKYTLEQHIAEGDIMGSEQFVREKQEFYGLL